MTLAFVETMKAVSLTGDEKPDSATVARLIVDLAKQGELDHSGHRPAVAKVLDLTEDWTEGRRPSIVGIRSGQTNEFCGGQTYFDGLAALLERFADRP